MANSCVAGEVFMSQIKAISSGFPVKRSENQSHFQSISPRNDRHRWNLVIFPCHLEDPQISRWLVTPGDRLIGGSSPIPGRMNLQVTSMNIFQCILLHSHIPYHYRIILHLSFRWIYTYKILRS